VRAAARTFRANPALDTDATITAQGVGEALASTLDADGIPTIVERIRVAPPGSRLGPITLDWRHALMAGSPGAGVYDTPVDRESAYETVKLMAEQAAVAAETESIARPPQQSRSPIRGRDRALRVVVDLGSGAQGKEPEDGEQQRGGTGQDAPRDHLRQAGAEEHRKGIQQRECGDGTGQHRQRPSACPEMVA